MYPDIRVLEPVLQQIQCSGANCLEVCPLVCQSQWLSTNLNLASNLIYTGNNVNIWYAYSLVEAYDIDGDMFSPWPYELRMRSAKCHGSSQMHIEYVAEKTIQCRWIICIWIVSYIQPRYVRTKLSFMPATGKFLAPSCIPAGSCWQTNVPLWPLFVQLGLCILHIGLWSHESEILSNVHYPCL